MKRFFFATVFMILAIGVGWRYASPQTRERLLGFVGMAQRPDPAGVIRGIKEKVMPEDPVARRSALTAALKEKIREIKDNAVVESKGDQSGARILAGVPDTRAANVGKAADEATQLVNQLEQANHDASVGGQVIQRVLDTILSVAQCQEK